MNQTQHHKSEFHPQRTLNVITTNKNLTNITRNKKTEFSRILKKSTEESKSSPNTENRIFKQRNDDMSQTQAKTQIYVN